MTISSYCCKFVSKSKPTANQQEQKKERNQTKTPQT